MTMRCRCLVQALVLLTLCLLFRPASADAIPAFARKYRVTCGLCHAPFPRLTAFGEVFAKNGFMMAPGEPARDTAWTGDPLLRLQRDLPLAIRLEAFASSLSGDDVVSTDLKAPWGIKLLSGGQISDDVSYYLYFFLTERGEVAGLEDAYLQFNDIFGTGVDLIAGQFQLSDPLFKRELRLEFEDYQGYRYRVGDVRADLTYERGAMATRSLWKDAELFVQAVNGHGLEVATSDRNYDRDSNKNVGVRLVQSLPFARIGGYFYGGKEKADGLESTLRVWGSDASVPVGSKVELNLQTIFRRDGNPFFMVACGQPDDRCNIRAADPLESKTEAYVAELLVSPGGAAGAWHFTGLYNLVDADRPVLRLRLGEDGLLERYQTLAAGAHYLRRRNLRFMAELSRDFEAERTRFTLGVVTAF